MVAIMGPSGSGKSTLMHILGLLHAPDLDDGPPPELAIDGRDMVALADRERTRIRAREMGFVFQAYNLVPTLTALENVALAADYAGHGGAAGQAAAIAALDLVGLADRAAPPAIRAVRRRAAARRDRAGAGQSAPPGPGRRADRQPRLGRGPPRCSASCAGSIASAARPSSS